VEQFDSVTQSLISITDEYAENGLLKEFNIFTDKLTEEVLRKKDVSGSIAESPTVVQSVYDSGFNENDEVFVDVQQFPPTG